jgi:O-antigen/teichoic acid export membrane protein
MTPQLLFRPAILALLVLLHRVFMSEDNLSAPTTMFANMLSFVLALTLSYWLLKGSIPEDVKAVEPQYLTGQWLRVSLPMLLISLLFQIEHQTDILVAGFFLKSSQVGIYAAARKSSSLIILGLTAVNAIVAPMISELYAQGKLEQLQRMLTLVAKGIFAITMPIGILMIAFGNHFLLIFGSDFTQGYLSLVICSIGQVIDALAGSVAFLMIMTGYQKEASLIIFFSTLINVILNIVLIPLFDIEGAAMATTISMIVRNVGLLIFVIKVLRINPTLFRSLNPSLKSKVPKGK